MAFNFTNKPSISKGFNFNNTPDPLKDVEYTGDLGKDAASELTAMQKAYRERAKAEEDRFKNATDSEFWFAVCFKTREHKERFIQAINAAHLGDKYLDGHQLSRILGIDIDDASN
ncbi:hypothetical protein [Trueperella pyogenes]